jgi:hypothetical protein
MMESARDEIEREDPPALLQAYNRHMTGFPMAGAARPSPSRAASFSDLAKIPTSALPPPAASPPPPRAIYGGFREPAGMDLSCTPPGGGGPMAELARRAGVDSDEDDDYEGDS